MSPSLPGTREDVAVVTGGSRGIGRATVLRLVEDGYTVVFTYRDEVMANETVELAAASGGTVVAVSVDLERPADIKSLFAYLTDQHGCVDVLVLNAASTAFKGVMELRPQHLHRTLRISFEATLDAVQRAVPLMRDGASIIFVSGIDARRHFPGHALLASAKRATETLIESLACELAELGIRANSVLPGLVSTSSAESYAQQAYGSMQAFEDAWVSRTPLGGLARPEQIAAVISFLAGADASWITGQALVVDGGLSLT